MQPSYYQRFSRRSIVAVIIVLIVAIAGYMIYNTTVFRITKTDPSMSAVSQYSPFIKVYFSKTLNPATLKVSDFGGILSSSSASGKVVTLTFRRPLTVGKEYSITLNRVMSTGGDIVENKVFSFTAKNIPVSKLSEDQQKKVLADQDKYIPYSIANTTYVNFDELTDQGISHGQLDNIKTAIFDYSKTISQKFSKITLDRNSVNVVFRDPSARQEDANSATFTITAIGKTYVVRSEYVGLDSNTYTRIYSGGNLVFDNTAASSPAE